MVAAPDSGLFRFCAPGPIQILRSKRKNAKGLEWHRLTRWNRFARPDVTISTWDLGLRNSRTRKIRRIIGAGPLLNVLAGWGAKFHDYHSLPQPDQSPPYRP